MEKMLRIREIRYVAVMLATCMLVAALAIQDRPDDLLHRAVEAGDIETVSTLIEQGADVNARMGDWTPLHRAAAGHVAIARRLLAAGAEVDAQGTAGWTPLHRAVKMGQGEMATLLLANGADVHAKGIDGWTPLLRAAMAGRAETGHLLIQAGAGVNQRSIHNGWTVLHWAAFSGSLELVRYLLDAGAEVHARAGTGPTPQGNTPMWLATHYGHDEIRALLLEQAGP